MKLETLLASRARGRTPSPIRELIPYLSINGMISLGGGYPNPETFAIEEAKFKFKGLGEITIKGDQLISASQYGPTESHPLLREKIIDWHHHKDGVLLDKSEFVTLNGSQEGIFIMAYLFLEKDDTVILSEPTYPGAISAFSSFTHSFLSIPVDENGLQTHILEAELTKMVKEGAKLPKFVYDTPHGHNPAGVSLSIERRKHLLNLAEKFDFLVLEDDPYQLIRLDDSPTLPTIQSLEKMRSHVIRLDSFSKIFAPGMRLGYASGPAEIIRQFVLFKQASNLHTSTFVQSILANYFNVVGCKAFEELIHKNCEIYRINRDSMIKASQEHLPSGVKYNIPHAGMFIWFQMPLYCDAQRMIERDAKELKVVLVPGKAFSTKGGCKNAMRASFSMVSPEDIKEGIRRFAKMIEHERSF